jgi:hypothetical protein
LVALSLCCGADLLHGFSVSARELGKLHVMGNMEECKAQLAQLNGARGLAAKLSTSLLTGIGDDVANRQEAYVLCLCAGCAASPRSEPSVFPVSVPRACVRPLWRVRRRVAGDVG